MPGIATHYNAVVIGAGQAGLLVSHYLKARAVDHVVLERRNNVASAWRDRWDSFRLVTTNRMIRLPGVVPPEPAEGFLTRDAVVKLLEDFAAAGALPIKFGCGVTRLSRCGGSGNDGENGDAGIGSAESGGDFLVEMANGECVTARAVICTTGPFQVPTTPAFAASIRRDVVQLHSSLYKNPEALPPGAVLVVGFGQSGAQIAKELLRSGRRVFMSLGERTACLPRRYRGRDTTTWLEQFGFFQQMAAQNPAGEGCRIGTSPALDWEGPLIPKRLAQLPGATLVGKVSGIRDGSDTVLRLRPEVLLRAVAASETSYGKVIEMLDKYITDKGIEAPPAGPKDLADGLPDADGAALEPDLEGAGDELDLGEAGVTSIIWATGYQLDLSWINLGDELELYTPGQDAPDPHKLYPRQDRGVVETAPGLYFVGLPFQSKAASSILYGVAEDAEYIAGRACEHIQGGGNGNGVASLVGDAVQATEVARVVLFK